MSAQDSTPTDARRSPLQRVALALLASLAIALALLATGARQARADGDPASDVLTEQIVFVPWDAGLSTAQQATLQALLKAAGRSGHPIRVALIESSGDLGSVTALWGKPQTYANFLGEELSLVYHGPLLVVMPHGFGLHGFGGRLTAVKATLSGIDAPAPGAGLGDVSIAAVRRISAALGDPLHLAPGEAAAASSGGGSIGPVALIVFAIGIAAILIAWAISLRSAPLRLRRRRPSLS